MAQTIIYQGLDFTITFWKEASKPETCVLKASMLSQWLKAPSSFTCTKGRGYMLCDVLPVCAHLTAQHSQRDNYKTIDWTNYYS